MTFKVMQPDGSITVSLDVANVRVCINQSYSNWAPVTADVPQGSALGPLLLLIYMNDLDTDIVSKMSKFPDYTLLCHRASNSDDKTELQKDINKFIG